MLRKSYVVPSSQHLPFATNVWEPTYRRGKIISHHLSLLQMTVAHGLPVPQLMLMHRHLHRFSRANAPLGSQGTAQTSGHNPTAPNRFEP